VTSPREGKHLVEKVPAVMATTVTVADDAEKREQRFDDVAEAPHFPGRHGAAMA
jgi:hypothetical protein